jgi:hypothetical protein
MKIILSFTVFLFITTAHANLNDCMRDAKTHGSHTSSLSPVKECADIIKTHPDKVEAHTADGKVHLYGLGHMLYVENEGNVELLAGNQTGLKEILKIEINEKKKRILVIQKQSVSTYKLDFIGNVSPISQFSSAAIKDVTRVKLLDNEEMIAIFSDSMVRIVNAEADDRHGQEKLKTKLLFKISGRSSLLSQPSDIVIDNVQKSIYVLDSGRILVYSMDSAKPLAPVCTLSAKEVPKLDLEQGQLFASSSNGIKNKVNLP